MQQKRLKLTFVAGAIVALSVLPAAADELLSTENAEAYFATQGAQIKFAPRFITWRPTLPFDTARLTVAGREGVVHRQKAVAGGNFSFDPSALEAPLPDGSYSWELVLSMAEGAGAESDAARAPQSRVISGEFEVRGGQIEGPKMPQPPSNQVTGSEQIEPPEQEVLTHSGFVRIGGKVMIGADADAIAELEIRATTEGGAGNTIAPAAILMRVTTSGSQVGEEWMLQAAEGSFMMGNVNLFGTVDQAFLNVEDGHIDNAIFISDNSDGAIGFGTTTPSAHLEISDDNSPDIILRDTSSGNFTELETNSAGDFRIGVNDGTNNHSQALRIDSTTGFVGVDTSNPTAPLTVVGNNAQGVASLVSGGTLQVQRGDTTPNIRFLKTAGTDQSWLFQNNTSTGTFAIRNETAARSPVQIFTSAQAQLLQLTGDHINVNGRVLVNNSQVHPDYVFEEDYELMSLEALEAFVREHKHLPGVQSASSVKEQGGVDLSGLSYEMLEKVEELTLYTIQQDKTIAELRAELEELREAVQSR